MSQKRQFVGSGRLGKLAEEEEVRSVLEEPSEEGAANLGRSYAQKLLSQRTLRAFRAALRKRDTQSLA